MKDKSTMSRNQREGQYLGHSAGKAARRRFPVRLRPRTMHARRLITHRALMRLVRAMRRANLAGNTHDWKLHL